MSAAVGGNGKADCATIMRTLERWNPRKDICPICGAAFIGCNHTIAEVRKHVTAWAAEVIRRDWP